MIKYTKKIFILLVLFFSLSLLSCANTNSITIRNCSSHSRYSECSLLLDNLILEMKKSYPQYPVKYIANFSNSFSNLMSLTKQSVDFAFIPFELFRKENEFEEYTQNLQVIGKVFFIPLLAVVPANSPYYSLKDLQGKNIGLGLNYDDLNHPAIINILEKLSIEYHPIQSKEIDLPALLEDKVIDMFLCFSVDCKNIIYKTGKVTGGVRLIPIENSIFESILEPIQLDISPYKGIKNKGNILQTLGSWEFLVTRKNMPKAKLIAIKNSLAKAIKDTHTLSLLTQKNN